MNRTHGQLLLDDFLKKLRQSLDYMQKNNAVELEILQPAWLAKDKLEAYLSTPQRDSSGKFLPSQSEEDKE